MFYIYSKKHKKPIICEYAIWIDELNLSHLRASKHLFLDGTWYKPGNFSQILIIQYKDIIINDHITGGFIIANNKKTKHYIKILKSFKNMLTDNNQRDLNLISITTDEEKALIKAIKLVFPNCIHINFYFHYKKDIIDYFRSLGYTK